FLEGSGGNIGVLHGNDGVMIVDDQFAQLSDKIKAAIAGLSEGKLKFVVNTHYHGDHTGGNENLSKNGAQIVAQDNVRARLKESFSDPIMGREVQAKASTFWPVITFSEEMSFFINDENVNIIYLPNAHTDGDALVYFRKANVIHTGDAFVRYGYPFIDVSAGGSIDGFIAAQDKILKIADENTKIIPGHGQISSINDVKELRDMLVGAKEAVVILKSEGKMLDDCINAKPLAKYHDRWSGGFINSDLFVRLIYESTK
ncbi:MBL fold metallo-hydrolase, partial [Fulvivirga lutimaris]|uniref:MBL fold metallo-hydrolase n=1 Tax=Fulvivirga lutimaris TaxID=1819566 RepID=UPI0012BCE423